MVSEFMRLGCLVMWFSTTFTITLAPYLPSLGMPTFAVILPPVHSPFLHLPSLQFVHTNRIMVCLVVFDLGGGGISVLVSIDSPTTSRFSEPQQLHFSSGCFTSSSTSSVWPLFAPSCPIWAPALLFDFSSVLPERNFFLCLFVMVSFDGGVFGPSL